MIEFILNGNLVSTNSDATTRLLDVLRNEFNLTGTKEGCGEGECGACSVLIDGDLVTSCITAIGSIKGKTVVTIEGFRETEQYKVLEKAFAKAGAVQCGFCTPGMILAAHALLSKKSRPTYEDIREAISGNLCRCTGYNMIVDAIMIASKEGKGLW
ncbi:(2Fe-2S)-binding protein [Defluviitalea phaphyphila]|uniref:(2Fe-2S)-binding protein n=1 Tax=Defluviitalea phaphyphila TaxID=1473580 RepID=UPI0007316B87|nr:(2Fe-2S)-binding protein [Defluviitalea phaphyphila]